MPVVGKVIAAVAAALLIVACGEPIGAPLAGADAPAAARTPADLTVKATSPAQATLDTTLDVEVSGSGFEPGARAEWRLSGLPDVRVRTNSTRFVSATSLVANITIARDAVGASYDVAVITPTGKTGIGTELFAVLAMQQLPGSGAPSNAWGVNANGDVSGGRSGGCNGSLLPVVWPGGGAPVDLPLIAPWCNGIANHINASGQIVGHLNLGTSAKVPVLWEPRDGSYTAVAMGLLPAGSSPDMQDINDSGFVTANHNGSPGSRPYWWSREGGWRALAIVPSAANCYAYEINEAGEVVGSCDGYPIFWSSRYSSPVLLPKVTGISGNHAAHGLNAQGVAVGYATRRSKSGILTLDAVRWTRAGETWTAAVLPSLGAGDTNARRVNDAGWIIGSSKVSADKSHAFLIVPGEPVRDLGSLGTESWGYAVTPSSAGTPLVVGISQVGITKRATIWRP